MEEILTNRPEFIPQERQLEEVRKRLPERPEKLDQLSKLFSTGFASKRQEIIGVRQYNLATFINQFLDGALPADQVNNAYIHTLAPNDDFFYIQPVVGNSFWRNKARFYKTGDFRNQIRDAAEGFSNITFKSAFYTNVEPVLIDAWIAKVKALHTDIESSPDYQENSIRHQFMDDLAKNLRSPHPNATSFRIPELESFKVPVEQIFPLLLRENVDKAAVIRYLQKVARERRGIVVGFNKHVLQGNWLAEQGVGTHANPDGGIAVDPEVAIQTNGRPIDLSLNPISAIEIGEESYRGEFEGNYEQRILQELGIISK